MPAERFIVNEVSLLHRVGITKSQPLPTGLYMMHIPAPPVNYRAWPGTAMLTTQVGLPAAFGASLQEFIHLDCHHFIRRHDELSAGPRIEQVLGGFVYITLTSIASQLVISYRLSSFVQCFLPTTPVMLCSTVRLC